MAAVALRSGLTATRWEKAGDHPAEATYAREPIVHTVFGTRALLPGCWIVSTPAGEHLVLTERQFDAFFRAEPTA